MKNGVQEKPKRGRPGVTTQEVHDAYYRILAVGGKPTIRNVRAMLGNTGSLITISRALNNAFNGKVPRDVKPEEQRQVTIAKLENRVALLESQLSYLLETVDTD